MKTLKRVEAISLMGKPLELGVEGRPLLCLLHTLCISELRGHFEVLFVVWPIVWPHLGLMISKCEPRDEKDCFNTNSDRNQLIYYKEQQQKKVLKR